MDTKRKPRRVLGPSTFSLERRTGDERVDVWRTRGDGKRFWCGVVMVTPQVERIIAAALAGKGGR